MGARRVSIRIPMKRQSTLRSWHTTEDGLAVWLGLIVVGLALPAAAGVDLLGWLAAPQVWIEASKAVQPISKAYAGWPGAFSLLATVAFILALVGVGAFWLGLELRKFVPAFTIIYCVSVFCWLIGHYAYIAQTPDKRAATGISWSLGLTGEAGFIVALLAGLSIGNFLSGLTARLKKAARPELFIETAIVIPAERRTGIAAPTVSERADQTCIANSGTRGPRRARAGGSVEPGYPGLEGRKLCRRAQTGPSGSTS